MIFIAEFCQNHNGDFELLKDMISAAKEAGCDYAKIQTIFADTLSKRERFEQGEEKNGKILSIKRPYQAEYDRLKKLELTWEQQAQFVQLCQAAGIKPLTTVFCRSAVPKIRELGFQDVKIASYDCSAPPLLREIKQNFNQLFVSTGASFDEEIEAASDILQGSNFGFLHAVTQYPTPLHEFHLARMDYLRKWAPLVGWSDHSHVARDGIKGTLAAVYYGAEIIERHFTLLPADQTRDGPVSVTPAQVAEIVSAARLEREELKAKLIDEFPDFEKCFGQAYRSLGEQELLNRDYYRGRFVSFDKQGEPVFNWEDKAI